MSLPVKFPSRCVDIGMFLPVLFFKQMNLFISNLIQACLYLQFDMSDDTLLNLKNCALNVQGHLMTFEYLLFGMLQTEPFGQLLNYALNDLVALYLSKLSYLLFKQNARNR